MTVEVVDVVVVIVFRWLSHWQDGAFSNFILAFPININHIFI